MSKKPERRDPVSPPKIAGYEFLELIGTGGQGAVYRARQLSLDRVVAIKLLSDDPASDAEHAARFLREARLASRLHHPNILQAIDVGDSAGQLYFVMEFVSGPDARTLLAESGPMREADVIHIGRQVASALHYTAERGVFHGDIKPENLVVAHDGTVKIVDFGIAGLLRRSRRSASGTRGFIAPEVLSGGRVDARSDLFSLGVTLFEFLTGRLPETGVSLGELRPDVSSDLGEIVDRLVTPDPRRRFANGTDLANALSMIRVDGPGAATSPPHHVPAPPASEVGDRQPGPPRARRRRARYRRSASSTLLVLAALVAGAVFLIVLVNQRSATDGARGEDASSGEAGSPLASSESTDSIRMMLASALVIERPSEGEISTDGTVTIRGAFALGEGATLELNGEEIPVEGTRFERTLSGLGDGRVALILVARHTSGVTHSLEAEVVIDTTPPDLDVMPVGKDGWTARTVIFEGKVRDATPVILTVDGDPVETNADGAWTARRDLPTGSQSVEVVATDAGGLKTRHSVDLSVDDTPPVLEFEPFEERTAASEILLRARATDDGIVESVTIGGEVGARMGSVWQALVPLANEGENEIAVVVHDAAENEAFASVTVVRDTTPPRVEITSDMSEIETGDHFTLQGIVDEPDASVHIDGRPVPVREKGDWSVELRARNTPWTVTIVATDTLGNQGTSRPEIQLLTGFAKKRRRRRDESHRGEDEARLAVERALEWLARHQSGDGSWDCDAGEGPEFDDSGGVLYDVGVSGLALLAFLGAGETNSSGRFRENVSKGLAWLRAQQDAEGCFGDRSIQNFTYLHAIGTLTMVEAFRMTRSPRFKSSAQEGVGFILRCQNPYKAWRYGERTGDNDTSVTGWMVVALQAAKDAGLDVGELSSPGKGRPRQERCFQWALDWIEEMTDDETGRTGYIKCGESPVREERDSERFPGAESESLTAVGIVVRLACGQRRTSRLLKLGMNDVILKQLPAWDTSRGCIDMYYWYYGSLAAHQVGGKAWRLWKKALQKAVLENQRQDDDFRGSWDPVGPWGEAGGRIYSTAMIALCLETEYRSR